MSGLQKGAYRRPVSAPALTVHERASASWRAGEKSQVKALVLLLLLLL